MSRIAFLMLPEPGHLLPTFRVARNLQDCGHAVCYVAPPSLEQYISGCGFECQTVLSDVLPRRQQEDLLDTEAGIVIQQSVFRCVGAQGREIGLRLISDLRALRFDILVCDSVIMQHSGEVLCAALDVPVVSLSVVFLDTVPDQPHHVRKIVLCPREFDVAEDDPVSHLEHTSYVEPSIFRERPATSFDWNLIQTGRRLVYCSFGTQSLRYPQAAEVLENVIRAFEELPDLELVVAERAFYTQLNCRRRSSNVHLVRTAPQLEMLDRASVFITHGGLGGLKESILIGVPTLTIPFDMDQPRNAARARHHRLGERCDPSACTPEAIQELSRRVLEDGDIRSGVARMKEIFQAREIDAPAAGLITETVGAGRQWHRSSL